MLAGSVSSGPRLMSQTIVVVLSGGSGTRLWPLSRELRPKQLLPLVGARTLLQDTVLRSRFLAQRLAPPIMVCSADHRFLVAEQLREIGVRPQTTVLEPPFRWRQTRSSTSFVGE